MDGIASFGPFSSLQKASAEARWLALNVEGSDSIEDFLHSSATSSFLNSTDGEKVLPFSSFVSLGAGGFSAGFSTGVSGPLKTKLKFYSS